MGNSVRHKSFKRLHNCTLLATGQRMSLHTLSVACQPGLLAHKAAHALPYCCPAWNSMCCGPSIGRLHSGPSFGLYSIGRMPQSGWNTPQHHLLDLSLLLSNEEALRQKATKTRYQLPVARIDLGCIRYQLEYLQTCDSPMCHMQERTLESDTADLRSRSGGTFSATKRARICSTFFAATIVAFCALLVSAFSLIVYNLYCASQTCYWHFWKSLDHLLPVIAKIIGNCGKINLKSACTRLIDLQGSGRPYTQTNCNLCFFIIWMSHRSFLLS